MASYCLMIKMAKPIKLDSIENRYQNSLESMEGSEFVLDIK